MRATIAPTWQISRYCMYLDKAERCLPTQVHIFFGFLYKELCGVRRGVGSSCVTVPALSLKKKLDNTLGKEIIFFLLYFC